MTRPPEESHEGEFMNPDMEHSDAPDPQELRRASALAAWLEAPDGTTPPPEIEDLVEQAVLVFRPEAAPSPRVNVNDILDGVRSGPLSSELIPFPGRSQPAARAPRWRVWLLPGAGLLAAAVILLVVIPKPQFTEQRFTPSAPPAADHGAGASPLTEPGHQEPLRREVRSEALPSASASEQLARPVAELQSDPYARQPSASPQAEVAPSPVQATGAMFSEGDDALSSAATPAKSTSAGPDRGSWAGEESSSTTNAKGRSTADRVAVSRAEAEASRDQKSSEEKAKKELAEGAPAASMMDVDMPQDESAGLEDAPRARSTRTARQSAAQEQEPESSSSSLAQAQATLPWTPEWYLHDTSLDPQSRTMLDRSFKQARFLAEQEQHLQAIRLLSPLLSHANPLVVQDAAWQIARWQVASGDRQSARITIRRGLRVPSSSASFRQRLLDLEREIQ